MLGSGKVGHKGRLRIALRDVEDVALDNPLAPEAERIAVIADLQYTPANVGGVFCQKALDIVAVDREPPVEAPFPAHRHNVSGRRKWAWIGLGCGQRRRTGLGGRLCCCAWFGRLRLWLVWRCPWYPA